MIYADTSALVKLVAPESESAAMKAFATSSGTIFTSVIGATELRRAIRRNYPERLVAAEGLLSRVNLIEASKSVLLLAEVIEPATLRTLDAIHLASALSVIEEIDGFAAYDVQLSRAARAVGLTAIAPE